VAADGAGALVLADAGNNALRLVAPSAAPEAPGGVQAVVYALAPGNLSQPLGVAFAGGDLFVVAGYASHLVSTFSLADGWKPLAGGGAAGYADGEGTAAAFNYPTAAAVDAGGVAYVADALNARVRAVTPAGAVTTLVGGGAAPGAPAADGVGTAAVFVQPSGVLLLSQGGGGALSLLVTDAAANQVRLVVCTPPVVLSAGAIAGIVIAALTLCACAAALEDRRRRRARAKAPPQRLPAGGGAAGALAASWRSLFHGTVSPLAAAGSARAVQLPTGGASEGSARFTFAPAAGAQPLPPTAMVAAAAATNGVGAPPPPPPPPFPFELEREASGARPPTSLSRGALT